MSDGQKNVETPLVTLSVPEAWESSSADGADLIVAAPHSGAHAGFRPNLVVTSVPSSEPVEVLSSVTIASAYESEPGAHVVACDVWPHARFPGRRIEFGYDSPLGWVYVTRWVFATGAEHVHLTASRAADDVLALDGVFTGMALGLSFAEGA